MTNHKELAERILKTLCTVDGCGKTEEDYDKACTEAVESILSEYQGEAVAYAVQKHKQTGWHITYCNSMKIMTEAILERNQKEFPDIGWRIAPLYLSAPLKKENDNGR